MSDEPKGFLAMLCPGTKQTAESSRDSIEESEGPPAEIRSASSSSLGSFKLQTRHILVAMSFWCFFGLSSLRMNISLAIVAMVNWTAIHRGNATVPQCSFDVEERIIEDGEFAWDSETQGIILSAYFYGLAITQIPGGRLAELYTAKGVLFWGNFIASVTTFLSPLAAWWDPYALVVIQIIKGGGHGIILPSISVLMCKWIPPTERNTYWAYIGSGLPVGAFVVIIISGVLSKSTFLGGWPSVFYVFGFVEVLWCILWCMLVYDSPQKHPRISREEREYIRLHCIQSRRLTDQKPPIPLKKILTSKPVWSYIIAGFATMWALCLYMSVLPTYMATILLFSIEQNGIMSSFPNLVQAVVLLAASKISTRAEINQVAGKTKIRKVCVAIGLLGFSFCLLGVIFARCNRPLNVFFLVMALGITGSNFMAVNCIPVDISPSYAGTISGMMSTIGSLSGIFIPTLIGLITENQITIEEWHIVFYLTIGLTLISVIIFLRYGSSEIQPWDGDTSHSISQ